MSSSSASGPHQYAKLLEGELRYLSLHPGVDDEPLECSLHMTQLAAAEFEALSYVWGSDVRDKQIVCDGHILPITTNLFNVLQRVRQRDAPRNLWADLICINQEDLDEKGHQVAIMGQIYRRASRVLILMSSNDRGQGPHVCSLIDDICTMIDQMMPQISEEWNTFPYPKEDEPLLTDVRWDSLRLLVEDVWFTRGWVVREAGFAQDALVIWGSSTFSWYRLMQTLNWLYKRAVKTLYGRGLDSHIPLAHIEVFEDRHPLYAKLFTTEMTWVNQSLLGYLSLTRQLQLKDPRDRVYAFLELVQNEERRIHLRPNYKDHFLHVYHQFAVEYIRSTGYIGLLSDVEHNEESLKSGIPSWVPRWDLALTRTGYAFAPADSGYATLASRDGSVIAPTVTDAAALKLRGAIIDSVLYASEALDNSTTSPNTIHEIWRAIEGFKDDSPYAAKHRLSIFVGVLTAGTSEGDFTDWVRSEAAYYQGIYQKSRFPDELEPPTWLTENASTTLFHNTVKGYTHNRKIILTKRGYMGLAPAVAQTGDSCGIIFGCTTPSILRPSDTTDYFQYLGAAFIVGKNYWTYENGPSVFNEILGGTRSKEWTEWGVEERDILLC